MTTLTHGELQTGLEPFGITLEPHQAEILRAYLKLLLYWNERVNLTSIRAPSAILSRHFGESLYLARLLALNRELLVDVGSGAGFPGLALKIVCPELRVMLVESVGKKVAFLKEATRLLGFSHVEVEQRRFEILAREWTREPPDVVCARAVGQQKKLTREAARILAPGGKLALYLVREDAGELVRESRLFYWHECRPLPTSRERVILLGTKA